REAGSDVSRHREDVGRLDLPERSERFVELVRAIELARPQRHDGEPERGKPVSGHREIEGVDIRVFEELCRLEPNLVRYERGQSGRIPDDTRSVIRGADEGAAQTERARRHVLGKPRAGRAAVFLLGGSTGREAMAA